MRLDVLPQSLTHPLSGVRTEDIARADRFDLDMYGDSGLGGLVEEKGELCHLTVCWHRSAAEGRNREGAARAATRSAARRHLEPRDRSLEAADVLAHIEAVSKRREERALLEPRSTVKVCGSVVPDLLVMKGHFDPSLTTESLISIAEQLAAQGVRTLQNLVIDGGALAGRDVPEGYLKYGDEDWEYLARPRALSVGKNCVNFVVRPGGAPGGQAVIASDQSAFAIRGAVKTVDAQAQFKIGCDAQDVAGVLERDASGKAIIDVWGTIAADYDKGKKLRMKSPEPAESFGDRMRFALEKAGITLSGDVVDGELSASAPRRVRHQSAPLAEVLKESLATSNAFDYERFALAGSEKEGGGPTTLQQASARLDAFLERTVDAQGARMANGSGIGNENLIAAQDIVKLLDEISHNPKLAVMQDALAAPGKKGTLGARMIDTPAEGLLRAKTGTGAVAVALSGFVGEPDNDGLLFSFLIDKHKTRAGARAALAGCIKPHFRELMAEGAADGALFGFDFSFGLVDFEAPVLLVGGSCGALGADFQRTWHQDQDAAGEEHPERAEDGHHAPKPG